MQIFRAVGLGLAIIMLKFLVPRIFAGIESTILVFFDAIQGILTMNQTMLPASVVPGVAGL